MRFYQVALLVVLAVSGCAAQKLIGQGDKLLAAGKPSEAIEKYEEAQKIDPSNTTVVTKIRDAKRAAVRAQLDVAEKAFVARDFALSLKEAQRARRLPLDLEDVDLVRRIDDAIAKASQQAEAKVAELIEAGHYVPAVILSQQVRDATPGMTSREKWAADIRAKAQEYYQKQATDLESNLPGAAAVQWALAKEVGKDVPSSAVVDLWNRFATPTCFAAPDVTVTDASGAAASFVPQVQEAARAELEALRARCGEGTQPLGVTIQLSQVDVVDRTEKVRGVKPLPGVKIKTEETYIEEEPYTVVEEVTDYEVRKEMQEKRDCAPRPGRERGCRTWNEEVEVKVPVKRLAEVQKVRRIERKRPVSGELPADKVVTYDMTQTTRRVTVKGSISVLGAGSTPRLFTASESSEDTSHDAVAHPKMPLEADPMEAKSVSDLQAATTVDLRAEVATAVALAVEEWSKKYDAQAAELVIAGKLPEAEELYLKLMALGITQGKGLSAFFDKRYGRQMADVMNSLVVALGRVETTTDANASASNAAPRGFPKMLPKARENTGPVTTEQAIEANIQARSSSINNHAVVAKKNAAAGKPAMTDEELKALEQESLGETKKDEAQAQDGTAAPVVPPAVVPGTVTPVEQPAPRGPIKPKS